MHGNYRIKVFCNDVELLEYSAPTHPQGGQLLKYAEDERLVSGVRHVLKSYYNGGAAYVALDYVEVKVY